MVLPLLAILVLCGLIASTSANRCANFSIGHCKPKVDALNLEQNGLTQQACQEFCKITANCLFYRFEAYDSSNTMKKLVEPEGNCQLYTEDYEERCNLYGGDQNTDILTCLRKNHVDDDCELFSRENCAYDQNVLFDYVTVNPLDCQNLCNSWKDTLQCHYWVYESSAITEDQLSHCKLYSSWNPETCTAVLGPQYPFHSGC